MVATDVSSPTTRTTARRTRVVVVVRVLAVLLLVGSAVTGFQAAWTRYSVCFVGGDPPVSGLPEDGAGGCVALQDHLYDYTVPSEPWAPIADAATWEGVSLLALGLGVVLVSATVAGRWLTWLLATAAGAAVGAMWLSMGVPTLLSGLADEPVYWGPSFIIGQLFFFVPWFTVGLAVFAWQRATAGTDPDGRPVAVFWAAMTVALPLSEFFITLMLWSSHDSSPLTGLFRCAAVVVAAVAVAATLIPAGRRPRLRRPQSAV
jgi:hypothetical protein